MGKCVVPFSEEQKFAPTCVAREACVFEGTKGHGDVRYEEQWSTLSYFPLPPQPQIFLLLAKGGQVLQFSPGWFLYRTDPPLCF